MPRAIAEQVVVITGASSGIGRETALRFAGKGAAVVLTARNREALREVEREITEMGGRALVVPADVANWGQVQQVARQAEQRFGRIDTWVNNAAVSLYGSFEQVPIDEFKRVIDVNLMGQVNGAKAALPHLKASHGTLIGIGSAESEIPAPLRTAYVASEQALKGFYDSLRLEQRHGKTGVRISFLMPASIDTPLYDHAMTHLGVKPGPLPPVYSPNIVADAILRAARRPIRDMVVGAGATPLVTAERLWPRLGDATIEPLAYRTQFTGQAKSETGPNALWQPVPGKGAIRDGFRALTFDPYAWVRLRPAAGAAVLGGLALAGLILPVAGMALFVRRRLARFVLPTAAMALGRRRPAVLILPLAAFLLRRR